MNKELKLSRKEMRALGYRTVDLVADHFARLSEERVSVTGRRRDLERLLREDAPESPRAADEVFQRLERDVLSHRIGVDHPRNFAFVPGPNNFVGALADFIAAGFNVFAGTWLEASGPAQIELVTLDWLKKACGLSETAAGLFVSGGSAANLTCLMVARQEKLPHGPGGGVAYCSSQTHSSMERAFRVLGFLPGQVRRVATDDAFRLSIDAVERAVTGDRAKGLRPFCVVANAGTTNTGAVDPLPELAAFCRREGLWLHVDGAYGAVAALSPKGAPLLEGLEEADSLSLDPHKWLFQPYESGCAFVRDGRRLKKHFHVTAEYLEDVKAGEEEVNFCDSGIQLTRAFRALKLWMTVQMFGMENVRAAVTSGIERAERAEAILRGRPGFEIVTGAQLGIVSFRYVPNEGDPDAFNRNLVKEVMEDGYCFVSTTQLRGKTAIRLCPINPRTTDDDLERSVFRIAEIADRLA